nr:PLP-dependent transferase [Micrococcus luteus]
MSAAPPPPAFGTVLHHRAHGMAPGESISPPLVHASAFHLPGADPDGAPTAPGADVPFQYARWATPTWSALEAALGALEDADVAVVPSGMAAIAAVLLPCCTRGTAPSCPRTATGPPAPSPPSTSRPEACTWTWSPPRGSPMRT